MGKFIQRPIPINAIKYDGEPETYRSILREIDRFSGRVKRHIDATVFVRGLNGSLKIAKPGNYVVRMADNTLDVVDEVSFEKEYTPIPDTETYEELNIVEKV